MNRIEAALVSIVGVFILAAAFSGFIGDAQISSQRLGSDFTDSRYHQYSELSNDRAEQRTRRQLIGLEAVGGMGLIVLSIVAYKPKRAAQPRRIETAAVASLPIRLAEPTRISEPVTRTREIVDVSRRRRPNGNAFANPKKVA